MQYEKTKNKIIVKDKTCFNIAHILECGQIFNYEKLESGYIVFSKDKMAMVKEFDHYYEIETKDVNYFINFFDLDNNYNEIKRALLGRYDFLDRAINFGYGIRILKQDALEMIVSFIISANNNIPRIKNSIRNLCNKYGEKKDGYFAFPTLKALQQISESEFKSLGIGYRSCQMVKAIQYLSNVDIEELKKMPTKEQEEELLRICGVGPKVKDCIMLFGLSNKEVFPVDTWIEKVYNNYFSKERQTNRVRIRENLVKEFGSLSGYAQQYLFYFERSGDK